MATGMSLMTYDGAFIASAVLNVGTASATTVVAALAGARTRIYKAIVTASGANQVTVNDGTTAITGPINLSAGVPLVIPFDGQPWLTTSIGNALTITPTTAASGVTGIIWLTQNANANPAGNP